MTLIGRPALSASAATVFLLCYIITSITVPRHSAGGDVLRRANFVWNFSTDVPVVVGTPYDFCVGRRVVFIA